MPYEYTALYNLPPKVNNVQCADKIKQSESDLQRISIVNLLRYQSVIRE